jgi:4-hydroxy-2-oxoheptanedioate aldolase
MTGEQMKATLRDGGRVYGTMITLSRNPRWARVFGRLGFDYIIVDTEHSPFGRGELADMLAMLERAAIVPIVRVPIPDPHYVTMVMDAGAQGVLAPYCETVAQVRAVVGGAKWRPLKGAFLERAVTTGEFPSDQSREYLERRNANSVAIIGIESVPAIENLESILDVPGIDAIFVGPNDLSITLGVPDQFDHPRFESALGRILDLCTARRVPVAVHLHNLAAAQRWMERGVRFVLHSSDTRAMSEGYRNEFDALRRIGAEMSGKTASTTEEVIETV